MIVGKDWNVIVNGRGRYQNIRYTEFVTERIRSCQFYKQIRDDAVQWQNSIMSQLFCNQR